MSTELTGPPEGRANRQADLMDALFVELLRSLALPEGLIGDLVARTTPQRTSSARASGETYLHLEARADRPHYPLTVEGRARNGLFRLSGKNLTGKTTLLLHSSILLGIDWEDKAFLRFLRDEERYAVAGRRMQRELETGDRSAAIEIGIGDARIKVSIADGEARVATGSEEPRCFLLREDGWRGFHAYLQPRVAVQFVPQKKDYLGRVRWEVSEHIIRRLDLVLDALREMVDAGMTRGTGTAPARITALESRRAELDDQYRRAHEELENIKPKLDSAKELRRLEQAEDEAARRTREAAQLHERVARLAKILEHFGRSQEELAQLETEQAQLQDSLTRASGALTTVRHAVRARLSEIRLPELQTRVREALDSPHIGAWLHLKQHAAFAYPGLYSRIWSQLDESRQDERTFPFRDETFNSDITTLGQFRQLTERYRTWMQDYSDLLQGPLDQFEDHVSGCDDIQNEPLDSLESRVTSYASRVSTRQQGLAEERFKLDENVREIADALSVTTKDAGEVLAIARERLDVEGAWGQRMEVLSLVAQITDDATGLWASGGADTAVAKFQSDLRDLERRLQQAKNESMALAVELEALNEDVSGSAADPSTRAHNMVRAVITGIETYLRRPFASKDSEVRMEDLSRFPLTVTGAPPFVDVKTPIDAGLRGLVRDRCGSYYSRDATGAFRSNPIEDINLDIERLYIRTDSGIDEVDVATELSTGTSAAASIRSLASRTVSPEYCTVLLVDESGDVEPQSLAQVLYDDITRLPERTVGVFTAPTIDEQARLHDAQELGRNGDL